MIRFLLLLFSAIIPTIFILLYLKKLNKYHQSWSKILVVFLLGIAATASYSVFLYFHSHDKTISNPYFGAFYSSFIEAALPEEFLKLSVLMISCYAFLKLKNELQGIIFGTASALGFAVLENIYYVNDGGFTTALTRAITAVPGHALLGALMGYYFSKYYLKLGNKYLVYCLLFPILLHTAYDFMLMLDFNLFDKDSVLSKAISQLIISAFIFFVIIEFGMIIRIVLTVAKNQFLQNINSNPDITGKSRLIEMITVPSDASLLHTTRQYVYIFTALICITFGQPFGIFGLLFLRKIIDNFFKPVKIQRLRQQNLDDDDA